VAQHAAHHVYVTLCLQELGRRLKSTNPVVAEIFTLMSRDEARHAGFLNKAMSDFNLVRGRTAALNMQHHSCGRRWCTAASSRLVDAGRCMLLAHSNCTRQR
jgi:hypothetical protein